MNGEDKESAIYRLKRRLYPYVPLCGPYPRNDEAWEEWHNEQ